MKKLIILLGILFMIVGCNNASKKDTNVNDKKTDTENGKDTKTTSSETKKGSCDDDSCQLDVNNEVIEKGLKMYEGAIKSPVFKEVSFEEIKKMSDNKQSFIAFYTFKTCPWCQQILPILKDVANKNKQTVYYVVVKGDDNIDLRTKDNKAYMENYELVKEFVGEKIGVPAVINFKDGKPVKHHYETVAGHNAKQRFMTEEEKKECFKLLNAVFELDGNVGGK